MTKKEVLEEFVGERPEVVGAYGYGSGVFLQSNYHGKKPQNDLILIVEDLKKWHTDNLTINKEDYSLIGKVYLSVASIKRIKGLNKITYVSNIKSNGEVFKYGVIEEKDFIRGLNSWENIFLAGRFHKPTLELKSNKKLSNAILKDRESALIVACLLSPARTSLRDLYIKLCGLSYYGDTRMAFAENPNKVQNIVYGNFEYLEEIYSAIGSKYPFLERKDDILIIDHDAIIDNVELLPPSLLSFLIVNCTDITDLIQVRKNIFKFFRQKNAEESMYQTVSSIKTNGIVRSVPYALSKVSKRFKR